jgi:hypothetical protein
MLHSCCKPINTTNWNSNLICMFKSIFNISESNLNRSSRSEFHIGLHFIRNFQLLDISEEIKDILELKVKYVRFGNILWRVSAYACEIKFNCNVLVLSEQPNSEMLPPVLSLNTKISAQNKVCPLSDRRVRFTSIRHCIDNAQCCKRKLQESYSEF